MAVLLLLATLVLALTASTGGAMPSPVGPAVTAVSATLTPQPVPRAEVAAPDAAVTLVPDGTAAETALAVSAALYLRAPVVVLSGTAAADLAPAASVAVALGAPVLPVDPGGAEVDAEAVAAELDRLGAAQVVAVGEQAAEALGAGGVLARAADALTVHTIDSIGPTALGIEVGDVQEVAPAGLTAFVAELDRSAPVPATPVAASARGWTRLLPRDLATDPGTGAPTAPTGEVVAEVEPPTAPGSTVLLVDLAADAGARTAAAVATARAAGVPVVDVPGGDPRASSATVRALDGVRTVVALGSAFGSTELIASRVAAAETGVELPGGGQLVFPTGSDGAPERLYIALYGTPGTPALGVLGEQDVPATIARAQQTADQYTALTSRTVVPTLEIIATIASAVPEADGSYSRARSVDELRPLVEAAEEAGMAVVIDLQPGRTDFLTQAQRYADLLAYPHVGLALDPEWRLAPDQVHLRQIGSVGIDEVNAVADWLAQFTRDRALPQKMFVLHQFSLRMITERERLDTGHDELAVLIHADGQGSQPAKAGTWQALRQGTPDVHWGWKNFYDEDTPMLDPVQTVQIQPTPDLVTYQ